MDLIDDETLRLNRLCELNVMEQVAHVSQTNIVQNAWKRGQELSIHGWIYGIHDGIIRDLMEPIMSIEQVAEQYRVY
jgi:carbonic anhydrase